MPHGEVRLEPAEVPKIGLSEEVPNLSPGYLTLSLSSPRLSNVFLAARRLIWAWLPGARLEWI